MPVGQMTRRAFIAGLGSATAWPLVARAQEKPRPVIGLLNSQSANAAGNTRPYLDALQEGLKETGYIEGQNVTIERRWAEGHYERLPELAADLLEQHPSVIVTLGGSTTALAAKAATATVAIVFEIGVDPIAVGLVTSLNRPTGNVTGISHAAAMLGPKLLEILRDLLRADTPIAVLVNSRSLSTEPYSRDIQAAAEAIGQRIYILPASTDTEIDNAFLTLNQLGCGGLVVQADPFFDGHGDRIVALSARNAIPTIYPFVVAGGLISYAANITDAHRQLGIYVGKILGGAKLVDLPIIQGVKVELALNMQTAKALGITFPPSLLARADEVIE
jgi:putative ABC transport system substrate-binding protein